MRGDRAEHETMMEGRELAAAGMAQDVLNFEIDLADSEANGTADFEPLWPFGLDRRDREKQRSGKVAVAADAGLFQRFLWRHLGETFGEAGGGGGLDGNEVNRAGHRRHEAFDWNPRHGADAGFTGRQLGPIILLAGAERGDHAHAGDDDDRPAELVAWCCHDPPVDIRKLLLDRLDQGHAFALPVT